jgi:type II secretory pathway component PulF
MADFAYIARDYGGQRVAGTLSAATQREAMTALAGMKLFPVEVKQSSAPVRAAFAGKVRPHAMAQFFLQLSALMKSGVPLLRSLEVLGNQSASPALQRTIVDLRDRIADGESLSEAMSRHPRTFNILQTSIVRAGIEGGFLEEALERVARFIDQQAELKSRVMGALAYPMFLIVFSVSIVTVLIVYFVPQFETLFSRLRARGELPILTDWLLGLSTAISSYGIFIAIGIGLLVFAIKTQIATEAGRWFVDKWKLKIPQAGSIYCNLAVSRFCRVLGTLLSGGVPIVRALTISADSTGNRVLTAAVNNAADNLTSGEPLASPLKASGHFPPDVVEMISVAEQSNTLETVLTDIADSLEKQTWRKLDLMVRLVEPLMLLVMASAVLVIVVALLLPMLKSATAL